MSRLCGLAFALALLLSWPCLAAPPLALPDQPLGTPGAGLPVNLLLNFGVTFEDAGAAYREPYRAARRYQGYFNAQLCYQYPMVTRAGAVPLPDLGERSGYFYPAGAADARHECRGAFSGNFLNWASTATLDLLRLGLTGGDRVIDETGMTVLQRAWLPDGRSHPDFYAHPDHFPRKMIPLGADASAAAAVTPFGTDRLFVVSCRNRLLFSNTGEGKGCDAARVDAAGRRTTSDKFFGEFNARVQVCTPDDAALRPQLCTRYRDAYKPQGVLQEATRHIGVMSYLTESHGVPAGEYGGVLRAPLKALGAPPAGGKEARQARSTPEWNPDTGVLSRDPDKNAGLSGAINTINLLGRGNHRQLGAYSRGDPGAELYYEALRYLQGRPPSIAAGPATDGGLPVWRSAGDPVTLGCQRNIVATIGHPVFAMDRDLPGNAVTRDGDPARAVERFAPAAFDVMQATRRVGQLEAASGAGAGGLLLKLDQHSAGAGGSYYLAGAAYWAHTNPVRSDKPVRVDSHALELGAASRPPESVLYYAAKYGAFDDRNRDGNPNTTEGAGSAASEWSNGAGKPRHYHPAPSPDDIVPALRALFGNTGGALIKGPAAAGVVGAAAAAADTRYLIETSYDSGNWSGAVHRRALRIGSGGAIDLAAAPEWDAGALLNARPAAERAIYTLARQPGQADRTVPFDWAGLPPDLRAHLDNPGGGRADGLGEARIAYLRGERTLEQGQGSGHGPFRRRGGILGDIVRSTPLIVGAPAAGGQGAGYPDFLQRHRKRGPVVYVGANDGMLHAFDAASGRELFAYIPHAVLPTLAQLASPGYRHRPYVDGSPGQGDALVRGRWISVLASGLGLGARGVFALDVSNPSGFGSGLGALWEFTERDDPAIGHVHAPPQIVKLNVAVKGGVPAYRYYVMVASGINPAAGAGALFLLALDKPPEQKWQPGLNYYKFIIPAGADSSPNALSAPAVAIAGDGSARYAYAGDLQGRLWRFDLTGRPPWGGTVGRPLFQARADGGAAQAIAHAPALVFAPGGGYLVLFGTGRFLEPADAGPDSFTPQSFYALHDRLNDIGALSGRASLEPRILSGSGPYRITGKTVSYAGEGAKAGWYVDFPNTKADGERAAGSPVVRAGALLFDTLLPGADGCSPPSYRSYLVDALSGFALGADGAAQAEADTGELHVADPEAAPSSAVLGTPLLLEIGAGSGPRSASGAAIATRSYALLRPGRVGKGGQAAASKQIKVAFTARRLSWRQIANWQDLHDKAKR